MLPVGWYRVDYHAQVIGIPDNDDLELIRQLVMVYDNNFNSYQEFLDYIGSESLSLFESESLTRADVNVEDQIQKWIDRFFPNNRESFGTDLAENLFQIARHKAQNGTVPEFFEFDDRGLHDLDQIAVDYGSQMLSAFAIDEELRNEYERKDRYWNAIYYRYDLFKSQYDACLNRILHEKRYGSNASESQSKSIPFPRSEASIEQGLRPEIKRQVKQRDGYKCLCCGSKSKLNLQVDHSTSQHFGGDNSLENLQTLCKECNIIKSKQNMSFRANKTALTKPPANVGILPETSDSDPMDSLRWERYLRRNVNFSIISVPRLSQLSLVSLTIWTFSTTVASSRHPTSGRVAWGQASGESLFMQETILAGSSRCSKTFYFVRGERACQSMALCPTRLPYPGLDLTTSSSDVRDESTSKRYGSSVCLAEAPNRVALGFLGAV